MVAVDAAIVGFASVTGQVLIPVPLLGAFIGSVAGKFVASAITAGLGDAESDLIAQLHAYEQSVLTKLDEAHQSGRLHAVIRQSCDIQPDTAVEDIFAQQLARTFMLSSAPGGTICRRPGCRCSA